MAEPTIATFRSSDGYAWQYRRYLPDSAPKAHVVYLHGIQSHGGWYRHSCERLRQAGYKVSFLDRRGSGLNQVARADAPSFRRLLDDIAEFIRSGTHAPGTPVFIVAVSWGGKLAVALQRRHPGLVDGLALLCPGFYPQVRHTFFQRLGILGARLVNPTRLFDVPLSDPELFTATPHWLEFLKTDPHAIHQATARFLVESVRLDLYLTLYCSRHVRMPVLLMLAEKDRIIVNEHTKGYVRRFAAVDQQVIEYPGAHHTLEFEPDPEGFVNDLLKWLDARTKPLAV